MGSLRNPVGPLPSSIYWRRRAVLLTVVALLALLATWVVTSGDGNGGGNENGANGKNPVPSITPGPTSSGPAISQAPGGRDESAGGGDTSGSGSDSGSGDDGSDASTGGTEATSGSGSGGSGDTGGGSSGEQIPAGSSLPNCTAGAVELTVRSTRNTYEPGQEPTFELIARNSSDSDCKVDLGPKKTVVTITQADGDDDIWSSADCPEEAAGLMFRVPAKGAASRTLKWNRKPSAPNCATPPGGSAPSGTYLVEAKTPSLTKAQTSFVLAKD